MVIGYVFFEVRTECLNIIKTSFDFKGLKDFTIICIGAFVMANNEIASY
jgi:hypothetical protein